MPRYTKYLIPLFVLILLGPGCLGQKAKPTTDGGVFKTTDAGKTWAQTNVIVQPKGVGTISGLDVRVIEIDPQDKSVVYIGTMENGLLYSDNTTQSWQQPRTSALKEGPINDIEVDPKDTCTVYVAKQEKLFKTTDCLRSFNSEVYVETRSGVFVRRIAVDWFNTNVVWIGLSNGDLLKSEDAGKTWKKIKNGKTAISDILLNQQDSRVMLVGTEKNGFLKTIDSGENWTESNEGLSSLRGTNIVNMLVQSANSDTVIVATNYGLIRTIDFGANWEKIELLTAAGQVPIQTVAIVPENASRIYYTGANIFYASQDGGNTWTTTKIPTTRTPTVIAIDPKDPGVLYVGGVLSKE